MKFNTRASFLLLSLIFLQRAATAAPVLDRNLINQATRPTVEQVEKMIAQNGPIIEIPDGRQLPKTANKPQLELQNDYASWFKVIQARAPHMITSFEKNIPGATLVFIGRDMSIVADLVEAFYRSIGQKDRVLRVGMSSGTVDSLTVGSAPENTYQFLKSNGLDLKKKSDHPYILVDAVSRGAGRQVRFLLKNIYHYLASQGTPLTESVTKYNAVGLSVFTTPDGFPELDSAISYFENTADATTKAGANKILEAEQNFMIYRDFRPEKSFLGFNEVGYTHWTGAWHESYGPIIKKDGKSIATPGVLAGENVRQALLQFSGLVISYVESEPFKAHIQQEAKNLGYQFPMARPETVLNPVKELRNRLLKAASIDEKLKAFDEIAKLNLGRVKPELLQAALTESFNAQKVKSIDEMQRLSKRVTLDSGIFFQVLAEDLARQSNATGYLGKLRMANQIAAANMWGFNPENIIYKAAKAQFGYSPESLTQYEELNKEFGFTAKSLKKIGLRTLEQTKTDAEFISINTKSLEMFTQANQIDSDYIPEMIDLAMKKLLDPEVAITLGLQTAKTHPKQASNIALAVIKATSENKFQVLKRFLKEDLAITPETLTPLFELTNESMRADFSELLASKKIQELSIELRFIKKLNLPLNISLPVVVEFGLQSSDTPDEYLDWALQNEKILTKELTAPLIERTFEHFLSFRPRMSQVNTLAAHFPTSSDLLFSMTIRSISSREELKELQLSFFRKAEVVKEALREFEARVPAEGIWKLFKKAQPSATECARAIKS